MIHYSEINDKKKNPPDLRTKIIATIARHSRSPNDLYEACRREAHLTRSEFRQLLDQMHCAGEIRINANNRVVLPKPPPETKTSPAAPEVSTRTVNRPDEILIHCLVNRSSPLRTPTDKKHMDQEKYYTHKNYAIEIIPLETVYEETLSKGYQCVPGEFRPNPDPDIGIRTSENWKSQQLFLLEFDKTTENTLDEFIEARLFLRDNAWLITESLRSRYDDPDDETCNGQLRVRVLLCMPDAVNTPDERDWIYEALVKELPSCDTGSANSITNGGLGNASAEFVKIGKIVDSNWFNAAIDAGRKAQRQAQQERERAAKERIRKRAERAVMGNLTEREGELPLEALSKSDPSLFLESLGLSLKSERGKFQHWGRPEKQGDTALSVWLSDRGNYQIRVFANSITTPPSVSGAMPFTRFYCYHELHTDIEGMQPDSQEWKSINAQLAHRGYGTWLSEDAFRQKHAPPVSGSRDVSEDVSNFSGLDPVAPLPPDHPLIANAPPVSEVREGTSFRYFSDEERKVVKQVLGISPDAGWNGGIPIWTPTYESLHRLTNQFALNGQPREVEKRRVYCTLYEKCDVCGAVVALWIDRYLLTAGYYCDSCHKDYPLGSYLDIELNRKLPNSIISEYQGFLGDNPDFVDFRLFQPGTLTHLGAGMGTGKTTEVVKLLVQLALQGLGKGIIVVPRVALALQLAYQLRWRHGHDAWGLYTEGAAKGDKFIGTHGAIVCLPSLPQAVADAEDTGIKQLYIAVDELDFGYELLSLSVTQATAVKKILRDALNTTGLVVAGQTESTLALEAFAEEIGAEDVQGFYNTAEPAEGHVTLKRHAADTNINAFLASGIDDITDLLQNGQNVYAFSASRRDGEILADEFSTENPLVYNAYTKGQSRAHELLRYQRLTDSRLFIGTSAAGVGISFLDKKAVTVILNGLIFGSRHANMATQEAIRDRGRRGVLMHYKPYNFSLPVRPNEQREVSLYHEALKQALDTTANINIPVHAITKIAAAQALASLADAQFETFVRYHLGVVGNMEIVEDVPSVPSQSVTDTIKTQRAEIRKIENELKKEAAKAILNTILDADKQTELLTSAEIRRFRNQGRLSTDAALANELANEAARAVGWDDTVDRFVKDPQPFEKPKDPFQGIFDAEDIEIAIRLVERNFDFQALVRKRDGYLAVENPNWTANRFELEMASTDTQLVMDGLGLETTAVKDPRFLGELLRTLIDALVEKVLETQSLVEIVRAVLDTKASTGKTYGQELRSGALGASEYRKARFLHCAEDDLIILTWVVRFISEWYPARLSTRDGFYGLQPDRHAELYLKSFERWLHDQPDVPDVAEIKLDIFEPVEMPESNSELRKIARERRGKGETLEAIAEYLGVEHQSVSRWCKGITPEKQTKETRKERQNKRKSSKQSNAEKKQERIQEAYRLHTQEGLSFRDIAKQMGKNVSTISRWMEKYFKF